MEIVYTLYVVIIIDMVYTIAIQTRRRSGPHPLSVFGNISRCRFTSVEPTSSHLCTLLTIPVCVLPGEHYSARSAIYAASCSTCFS